MSAETVIQQILRERPEITREQIQEKLDLAKQKTGGLIADATLLRVIAAELNIHILQEPTLQAHKLSIAHLVSGLNNVTITGRVLAVGSVRTFEGKKPGKFAGATVADGGGVVRVVLWNEQAEVVEQGALQAGVIARFHHGYTKASRDGAVELHMSSKSSVEVNPAGVNAADYASVDCYETKPAPVDAPSKAFVGVSALNEMSGCVNVAGEVAAVPVSRQVQTSKGETVKLVNFELRDASGLVRVCAWRSHAEAAEGLLMGQKVSLEGVFVKRGLDGCLELSTRAASVISKL